MDKKRRYALIPFRVSRVGCVCSVRPILGPAERHSQTENSAPNLGLLGGTKSRMGAGRRPLRASLLLCLGFFYPTNGAATAAIQEQIWPVGVTIAASPVLTSQQGNDTGWEAVRITAPQDGSIIRSDSIILRLEIESYAAARLSYIEARASDEEVTRVGAGVRHLTLHGVEPGTHLVAVWLMDGEGGCIGQADVMWDTVFPEGHMLRHRLLSHPEPPPPLRLSSSSTPVEPRSSGQPRVRLCFVTSLKLDGQRMIYLQQLQRLPRDRYEMVVLNNRSPRAREEDGRVFVQRLADMAIPLVQTRGLSVPIKDAEAVLGAGNVTEDSVVSYVLARLQANNNVVDEALGPPWVRHVLDSLTQAIRALSPDILVFANGRTSGDALLAACARLAGVRRVALELPNLFPLVPMPGLDLLIAPSHYAAQHDSVQRLVTHSSSRRHSDGHPLPTAVITPGVDDTRFFPLGRYPDEDDDPPCHSMCQSRTSPGVCEPGCVVVAYLGRLDPEKSPGLFLHMAAKVLATHPTARFQVIGYGSLRTPLERHARAMGLGPGVLSFTGPLFDELPLVLRRVGVVVNPSLRAWSETFCIANVEAMASGVPVVSFGVGGTGEYLQHDVNSLLVDEDGPEGLAAAVRDLLDDPARRQRLSLQARSTVLEHFTVGKQIERYDRLYMRLIEDLTKPI